MQPLDMADLREQILYNEKSPYRSEQEALEKRADRSVMSVPLYCPGCGRSLLTLDCDFCHASCGLLQQRILKGIPAHANNERERIETDTRVISLYADGYPQRELIRFDIRCLSCYEVLQRNEKCLNRCGLRTFLSFKVVDGWIILRVEWYEYTHHKELPITPGHIFENLRESAVTELPQPHRTDETFEPPPPIETQPPNQDRDTPQPSNTEESTSKHASEPKNVKQKIKQYFKEKDVSVATNKDLRTAIGCSRQSITSNVNKLCEEGWLMIIEDGFYKRLSTD